MWVRKKIDIGWFDLLAGSLRGQFSKSHRKAVEALETCWSSTGDALACLSVRSGLDLTLQALQLPKGSEVLVSAITIPDMVKILKEHGLVPVPVDLEVSEMAPSLAMWKRAWSPKTRAILVAHLFGGRITLDPVIRWAKEMGLVVFEDCAQAFDGPAFRGHLSADVSMFSFGTIKTSTALGGALLRFRDHELLANVRQLQDAYPVQGRWNYLKRIFKYLMLKGVSQRQVFSVFVSFLRVFGHDYDRIMNSLVKGFAGPNFFERIRKRPSTPLLVMMLRRLKHFSPERLAERTSIGGHLHARIGNAAKVPGFQSRPHNQWVFPILVDDPGQMISSLRSEGFDATQGQSLVVVEGLPGRQGSANTATSVLEKMVFLPCYPGISSHVLDRMAAVVRDTIARGQQAEELAEPVGKFVESTSERDFSGAEIGSQSGSRSGSAS